MSRNIIPIDFDSYLGYGYAPNMEAEMGGVSNDSAMISRVQSIGKKLSPTTDNPKIPYTFKVLNTDTINAFALPGGPVYVNKGLLNLINDNELAAVMGHELGHINARHSIESMERNFGLGIVSNLVTSYLHKSKKLDLSDKDLENINKFNSAMSNFIMLGYSRDNEYESDAKGLNYAVAAGYNPYGMLTLMKKFQSMQTREPSRFEIFFSTHPATGDRIDKIEDIIKSNYPNAVLIVPAPVPAPIINGEKRLILTDSQKKNVKYVLWGLLGVGALTSAYYLYRWWKDRQLHKRVSKTIEDHYKNPLILDKVIEAMNRGSLASVDTVAYMTPIQFTEWIRSNTPLKNAIKNWLRENKMFSTGIENDISKYLESKGYGFAYTDYGKDAFESFLKDIRIKSNPLKIGDKFGRIGYRAESGYSHERGATVQDVVDFEAEELGNIDTREQAESLGIDLNKIPAEDVIWITKSKSEATQYTSEGRTPVTSVDLPSHAIVLADDGEGGYLVYIGDKPLPYKRRNPDVPTFHSTEEARAYGHAIKGDAGKINDLQSTRQSIINEIRKIQKTADPDFKRWNRLAAQSQFYRESLEIAQSVGVFKNPAVLEMGAAKQEAIAKGLSAQDFAESLGVKVIEKNRKDSAIANMSDGTVQIWIPKRTSRNKVRIEEDLWHEIGHYLDDAHHVGGYSNLKAFGSYGKYSSNNKAVKDFKNYIIKNRALDYIYRVRRPEGKIDFRSIEEIKASNFSEEEKKKFIAGYMEGLDRISRYLSQDIELFAAGFSQFMSAPGKMKSEAPALYDMYSRVMEGRRKNPPLPFQYNRASRERSEAGPFRIIKNPIRPINIEIIPDREPEKYAARVASIYNELERTMPEFALRPELTVTKDKKLLWSAGGVEYRLAPGIFGFLGPIIADMKAGAVLRLTADGDIKVIGHADIFTAPVESPKEKIEIPPEIARAMALTGIKVKAISPKTVAGQALIPKGYKFTVSKPDGSSEDLKTIDEVKTEIFDDLKAVVGKNKANEILYAKVDRAVIKDEINRLLNTSYTIVDDKTIAKAKELFAQLPIIDLQYRDWSKAIRRAEKDWESAKAQGYKSLNEQVHAKFPEFKAIKLLPAPPKREKPSEHKPYSIKVGDNKYDVYMWSPSLKKSVVYKAVTKEQADKLIDKFFKPLEEAPETIKTIKHFEHPKTGLTLKPIPKPLLKYAEAYHAGILKPTSSGWKLPGLTLKPAIANQLGTKTEWAERVNQYFKAS